MKKKPVSSILFFSLFTLVVCNNVKTAELQSIRGLLAKAITCNDTVKKNAIFRDTLLRTDEKLKDCQSDKDPILTTLTECGKHLTTQESQLKKAGEETKKIEKKLKQLEELFDEIRKKRIQVDIKPMKHRSLLKQHKILGKPSQVKENLTGISYLETPVNNEAEEECTRLVYNIKQLQNNIEQLQNNLAQLKKENLVIKRILGNDLETEKDIVLLREDTIV